MFSHHLCITVSLHLPMYKVTIKISFLSRLVVPLLGTFYPNRRQLRFRSVASTAGKVVSINAATLDRFWIRPGGALLVAGRFFGRTENSSAASGVGRSFRVPLVKNLFMGLSPGTAQRFHWLKSKKRANSFNVKVKVLNKVKK